jgi:hypothetical protein
MDRREMLGILGAGAAGLTAMAGGSALAQGEGPQGLQIIDECARICNETATHCLHQLHRSGSGGDQAQNVHLRAHVATMDCQAFCHLTSELVARNSPMAAYAHQACADACRDCAEACDKGQDDAMKRCAEVCRRCEQHCRQQAQQGGDQRRTGRSR